MRSFVRLVPTYEYDILKTTEPILMQIGTSCLRVQMYDEIFHFEIFKNFMKILKYFKTPF